MLLVWSALYNAPFPMAQNKRNFILNTKTHIKIAHTTGQGNRE